jgi:hypothetical protein
VDREVRKGEKCGIETSEERLKSSIQGVAGSIPTVSFIFKKCTFNV